MNIFFRTNFGNKLGLGNLVRCDRLAQEFKKLGHKCFFIFDTKIQTKFYKFESFFLYKKKDRIVQLKDAKLVYKLLNEYSSKIIIVDDTRFNYTWQKFISKKKIKVISFTEGNKKKQYSDFIINYNPINFPDIKKEYFVSEKKNCKYLIHPKFNIISKNKAHKNFNFKKNFYFTFYIGGGGDLKILNKLLINVTKIEGLKKCKFLVIVGLFAKNKHLIKKLSEKNKSIELFESGKNINFVIKNSNFFIGSAGTALFETAYFKTPSMMLRLASNQSANSDSLEIIGHYFYHDVKDLKETKKVINLLITIKKNYPRIKKMFHQSKLKVDNLGSKRIINKILNKKINENSKIKINKKKMSQNFSINKVQDTDINHYLKSRNLKINRKNSSNMKLIKKLDHYDWWFKTNRKSYLLTKGEKKILYFYKEKLFSFNNKIFYLSGWFACTKDCEARDILYALNWQRKESKNVSWVSFVKNNNVLSLKMSKYVGWKIMNKNNIISKKISNKFNLKNQSITYFYR